MPVDFIAFIPCDLSTFNFLLQSSFLICLPLPLHYYPSDNFHSPWPHCVSFNYSDLADWSSEFEETPVSSAQLQRRELQSVTHCKQETHNFSSLVTFWLPWSSLALWPQFPCLYQRSAGATTVPGTFTPCPGGRAWSEEPAFVTILMFWCWWVCNPSTRQCLSWHVAVMRINICEEQLNIIVHFACQDSANIFSFPCWIWIYVASDTLDKHYIHHLSCSLASEKGTTCL